MTDRFYPVGKTSEEGVWQTSYEIQNEMRAFQRSAYPPGYAGHEPGARDKFGYCSPGPHAHRLANPDLALVEGIDLPEPRAIHAIPRTQVHDDGINFRALDINDVHKSKAGSKTFNLAGMSSMSKSMSTGSMAQKKAPTRLSEPLKAITKMEDNKYSYFVPKSMQREHQEKLMSRSLPKLHKESKVTMPFSGEGTGFKTCCTQIGWWPPQSEGVNDDTSSYKSQYSKPSFYRMSPMGMSYHGSP